MCARVRRIAVAVERVMDCELADLNRDSRDVLLAGHLAVVALDALLLAAEAPGLAQKQPRGVVVRCGKIRLLRLAIGEARGTGGRMQAEALQQLGIVIKLAALP